MILLREGGCTRLTCFNNVEQPFCLLWMNERTAVGGKQKRSCKWIAGLVVDHKVTSADLQWRMRSFEINDVFLVDLWKLCYWGSKTYRISVLRVTVQCPCYSQTWDWYFVTLVSASTQNCQSPCCRRPTTVHLTLHVSHPEVRLQAGLHTDMLFHSKEMKVTRWGWLNSIVSPKALLDCPYWHHCKQGNLGR